jgi:carbon monoxide dehydrogenase subunit G
MKVAIEVERSINIPAPHEKVLTLMQDLEGTIRRFPKLRRLRKVGDKAYVWEMDAIGSRIANISHEVVYGAKYTVDATRGLLSWKPLPNEGNATIEGAFRMKDLGGETRLTFSVKGELRDVPVPLVYRLVAPPFIQGKFMRLVEIFLENTAAAIGMSAEQVAASRA